MSRHDIVDANLTYHMGLAIEDKSYARSTRHIRPNRVLGRHNRSDATLIRQYKSDMVEVLLGRPQYERSI